MAKWLEFKIQPRGDRKTDIYEVWNKEEHVLLGRIGWYGAWRCYAFYPCSGNLVFERTCLRDIADFLDQLMEERKKQKADGTRT